MRRRIFIGTMLLAAWLASGQPGWSQGTIAYYQPGTPITLWIPPDSFDIARQLPFSFDGSLTPDLTFAYSWVFIGVRSEGPTRLLTLLSPPPNIGGDPAPVPTGFLLGPDSPTGSLQWFGDDVDVFERLIHCVDTGCGGAFRGQRAYMGVEFQRAGATHYGWVLLQISDYAAFGSIEAWAWETRTGVPILAGAVPEPSPWALFVGGGALIVWFRRKRNERRG